MKIKYTKKQIDNACALYRKGKMSLNEIARICKLSDAKAVLYHCNPERRLRMVTHSLRWRRRNPKAWKAIHNRAAKKYRLTHGKA